MGDNAPSGRLGAVVALVVTALAASERCGRDAERLIPSRSVQLPGPYWPTMTLALQGALRVGCVQGAVARHPCGHEDRQDAEVGPASCAGDCGRFVGLVRSGRSIRAATLYRLKPSSARIVKRVGPARESCRTTSGSEADPCGSRTTRARKCFECRRVRTRSSPECRWATGPPTWRSAAATAWVDQSPRQGAEPDQPRYEQSTEVGRTVGGDAPERMVWSRRKPVDHWPGNGPAEGEPCRRVARGERSRSERAGSTSRPTATISGSRRAARRWIRAAFRPWRR